MDYCASPNPKRERNTWLLLRLLMVFLEVVILVGFVLLILGLTVYKLKNPTITFNSISVENLQSTVDHPPVSKYVNLEGTLKLNISVTNPNKASFDYSYSYVTMYYNGKDVAESRIPKGYISAGETKEMIIVVYVSDPNFYGDMLSGMLHLSAYTRIASWFRSPISLKLPPSRDLSIQQWISGWKSFDHLDIIVRANSAY